MGSFKIAPSICEDNVTIMYFIDAQLLNDLIGKDDTIANEMVYSFAQKVFCLRNSTNDSISYAEKFRRRLTSCSGRSISNILISYLSWRIAFPMLTDIGRPTVTR